MGYVYVCAGCDLLAESARSDCMTCSPACRVRAYRSGDLKRLRDHAALFHLPPAAVQHAKAMRRLLPNRDAEMMQRMSERTTRDESNGSFYKDHPEVRAAFYKLLDEEVDKFQAREQLARQAVLSLVREPKAITSLPASNIIPLMRKRAAP
jgi:hypothetical protein